MEGSDISWEIWEGEAEVLGDPDWLETNGVWAPWNIGGKWEDYVLNPFWDHLGQFSGIFADSFREDTCYLWNAAPL